MNLEPYLSENINYSLIEIFFCSAILNLAAHSHN
jgi:hypothetical protein